MTHILTNLTSNPDWVLAQANPVQQLSNPLNDITSSLGTDLGGSVINLVKALAILIIGWIISGIVKGIIKKILNSTDIDNKIASWLTGGRGGGDSLPVEEWIANLFCWLIRLFVIVAFLNALQLGAVSAPLNTLLNQITGFLPRILSAGMLLGVAWVIATLVKTLVNKALGGFGLDRRLGESLGDSSDLGISSTIGNALYWFIFLLFLPMVLDALELNGALAPVQNMLNEVLGLLPNILGAVIIGAIGWFIANIVRRIVTNLLAATGVDNIGEKVGLSATTRGSRRQSLSGIIGTIVFVLVLIPTITAALDKLGIDAISRPATNMLNEVTALIPNLFAAAAVLALFFVAGRFVSEFVSNILASIGFDDFLQWLGISTPITRAETIAGETEQPTAIQADSLGSKTPSEFAGLIVLAGIMLIGALTAVDILGIPALQTVISTIMQIAGQVLVGAIVFAIGLYFANLAYNFIVATGMPQARLLAQAARIAILILVGAMALNRIGVAPDIVNLAFGLLLGGIAIAIALSFGLGGREVAKETLRSWVNSFKN